MATATGQAASPLRAARGATACACGGSCPRCQRLTPSRSHALEREADAAADQVLARPPDQAGTVAPGHSNAGTSAGPAGLGRGTPLALDVRQAWEGRFGHDFSGVRLHTGALAAQSALALGARAYTFGAHIVFGDRQASASAPSGLHLMAHELAHVVQQGQAPALVPRRHAAPVQLRTEPQVARAPLDDACGALLGDDAEPLAAPQWRRCVAHRQLDPHRAAELRFHDSGEIISPDRLLNWAVSSSASQAELKAKILRSSEFAGNAAVRQAGWDVLLQAFATESLAARRETVHEQKLMQIELQRQQAIKDAASQRQADRSAWISGHGSHRDNLLDEPGRVRQLPDRSVAFPTFVDASSGNLVTLQFKSIAAYADEVERRLKALLVDCDEHVSFFKLELKVDRELSEETMQQAAWYQKPGLAFAGLGFSRADVENAVVSLRFIGRARAVAKKALADLESGKGTPAGQGLNEAMREYLTARHWYMRMRVSRQGTDNARLGRLQTVSKVGDVAGMVLPPGTGLIIGRAKSAAVRISAMHTDPKKEFGFGSYLRESAADVVSWKLQTRIAGPSPGFGRTLAANALSNQTAKAIAAGDAGQFFALDRNDVLMVLGGSLVERGVRRWAARGQGQGTPADVPAGAPAGGHNVPAKPVPANAAPTRHAADAPLATAPSTRTGHHLEVAPDGIHFCSPKPCPLLRQVYRRELADPRYKELDSLLADLERQRLRDPAGTARKIATLEKRLAELAARSDVMLALPDSTSAAQRTRLQSLLDLGVGLDAGTLEGLRKRLKASRNAAAVEGHLNQLEEFMLGANTARNAPRMKGRVDAQSERMVEGGQFDLKVSERKRRAIASGRKDFALDHRLALNIDEGKAVGGLTTAGQRVSRAEAMRRALDPNERQFLDSMTNQRSKHVADAMGATAAPRAPVSVLTNPAALLTRRFGEVTELRAVFDQAVARVPGVSRLSPGQAKERINAQIHDIIRGGLTPDGRKVRQALATQGFEYVANIGLVAVRR